MYSNRPQIIGKIKGAHSRGEEREEHICKDYGKVIKENNKHISNPKGVEKDNEPIFVPTKEVKLLPIQFKISKEETSKWKAIIESMDKGASDKSLKDPLGTPTN